MSTTRGWQQGDTITGLVCDECSAVLYLSEPHNAVRALRILHVNEGKHTLTFGLSRLAEKRTIVTVDAASQVEIKR